LRKGQTCLTLQTSGCAKVKHRQNITSTQDTLLCPAACRRVDAHRGVESGGMVKEGAKNLKDSCFKITTKANVWS
jgi:hypothetical protein